MSHEGEAIHNRAAAAFRNQKWPRADSFRPPASNHTDLIAGMTCLSRSLANLAKALIVSDYISASIV